MRKRKKRKLVRRRVVIRVVEPTRSPRRRNQLLTHAFYRELEGTETVLEKVMDWDPDSGCVEMLVKTSGNAPVPDGRVEVIRMRA